MGKKLTDVSDWKWLSRSWRIYRRVSKAQGRLSYRLVSAKKGKKSFRKKFSVDAKTGKITVKKGLKKGTYKVKMKIRAKRKRQL